METAVAERDYPTEETDGTVTIEETQTTERTETVEPSGPQDGGSGDQEDAG